MRKDPLHILFVNHPSNPINQVEMCFQERNSIPSSVVIPLGILYLSSNLKKHKLNTSHHVIDYAADLLVHARSCSAVDDLIMRAAKNLDVIPDIICFSVMFSCSHPFLIRSLKLLKSYWPDAVSIVGGNHATNSTDILLEPEEVDFVVRGNHCKLETIM